MTTPIDREGVERLAKTLMRIQDFYDAEVANTLLALRARG